MTVEELEDKERFRLVLTIRHDAISDFLVDILASRKTVAVVFWSICIISLSLPVIVLINIGGYFSFGKILLHILLGLVAIPVALIPVHELLHIIPFVAAGARKIRAGFEARQYIFYATAHRYVTSRFLFCIVALAPFITVTGALLYLTLALPGIWKVSMSVAMFVHVNMCAGDFALMSIMTSNLKKRAYTWDDAELKEAYFYEEI